MQLIYSVKKDFDQLSSDQLNSCGLQVTPDMQIKTDDGEELSSRLVRLVYAQKLSWDDAIMLGAWPKFEPRELESVEYLEMHAMPTLGYPQPEEKYLRDTYSGLNACDKCNAAAIQANPFRIKKLPAKTLMRAASFHWAHEVFFSKDVFKKIFSDVTEVFSRPLLDKNGKVVEEFQQLCTKRHTSFDVTDLDVSSICSDCGARLYHIGLKSFFYKPIGPAFDVAMSDIFLGGSQKDIFFPLIVSQRIYKRITEMKIKGCVWWPCRL